MSVFEEKIEKEKTNSAQKTDDKKKKEKNPNQIKDYRSGTSSNLKIQGIADKNTQLKNKNTPKESTSTAQLAVNKNLDSTEVKGKGIVQKAPGEVQVSRPAPKKEKEAPEAAVEEKEAPAPEAVAEESSKTEETEEDTEFAELQDEAEEQDEEEAEYTERDSAHIDELIEDETINAKTQEGVDQIQDAIEELFLDREVNEMRIKDYNTELVFHSEAINAMSLEELYSLDEIFNRASELNDILSVPLGQEEAVDETVLEEDEAPGAMNPEDALIHEYEAQIDSTVDPTMSEQAIALVDESVKRVIKLEFIMESLASEQDAIIKQINQLQVKLGTIQINQKSKALKYKTRARTKTAGNAVIFAAKYMVPVTAAPMTILAAGMAIISFAKTIKHVINLKKLLKSTKEPANIKTIKYAISQKGQKALTKGAKAVGLGVLPAIKAGGSAAWKKIKGTKGKARHAAAKQIHKAALKGDQEAIAVVRELVGGNFAEAMEAKDGWEVISDKLKSK